MRLIGTLIIMILATVISFWLMSKIGLWHSGQKGCNCESCKQNRSEFGR